MGAPRRRCGWLCRERVVVEVVVAAGARGVWGESPRRAGGMLRTPSWAWYRPPAALSPFSPLPCGVVTAAQRGPAADTAAVAHAAVVKGARPSMERGVAAAAAAAVAYPRAAMILSAADRRRPQWPAAARLPAAAIRRRRLSLHRRWRLRQGARPALSRRVVVTPTRPPGPLLPAGRLAACARGGLALPPNLATGNARRRAADRRASRAIVLASREGVGFCVVDTRPHRHRGDRVLPFSPPPPQLAQPERNSSL